jgi:HEAT repeat protein
MGTKIDIAQGCVQKPLGVQEPERYTSAAPMESAVSEELEHPYSLKDATSVVAPYCEGFPTFHTLFNSMPHLHLLTESGEAPGAGIDSEFFSESLHVLLEEFTSGDDVTRKMAAAKLRQMRLPAQAYFFINALRHPESWIRNSAGKMRMIINLHDPAQAIIESLKNPDPEIRIAAAKFSRLMRSTDTTSALIGALKDENLDVRISAASSLMENRSSEAIPALIKILEEDNDYRMIVVSVFALGVLGALDAIEKIIDILLNSDDETILEMTARAILLIWNRNRNNRSCESKVVSALTHLLGDRSAKIRSLAAELLAIIGSRAEVLPIIGSRDAVSALRNNMEDPEAEVRLKSLEALIDIKPPELPEILSESLDDPNAIISTLAVLGLSSNGSPDAVPGLVKKLDDPDARVRKITVRTLAMMWSNSIRDPEIIPALIHALDDENPEVRASAATGLGFFIESTDRLYALPKLAEMLEDRDDDVRESAMASLRTIWKAHGLQDLKPVATLIDELEEPDARVRGMAAFALSFSDSPDTVRALTKTLRDPDEKVRYIAASSLIEIVDRSGCAATHPEDFSFDIHFKALIELLDFGAYKQIAINQIYSLYLNSDISARSRIADFVRRMENDPKAYELKEYIPGIFESTDFVTTEKKIDFWPDVTARSFARPDGYTITLFYEKNGRMLGIVPGSVKERGGEILINFMDKIDFYISTKELPMDAVRSLLRSHEELPEEFFIDRPSITYTARSDSPCSESDGCFVDGDSSIFINEHRSESIPENVFATIIHEFAHRWDFNTPHADIIFNSISWFWINDDRHLPWKQYSYMVDYGFDRLMNLHRADFDINHFARDYGMIDPDEDLATMTEDYVVGGANLRNRIRRLMEGGSFELAVKYLFVKHFMPFAEKEYELSESSHPLTIAEVRSAYASAPETSITNPHISCIIQNIESLMVCSI